MKLLSPLALFTVCGLLAAPLMAAQQAPELTGCAAKVKKIETQLEYARAHNNPFQVAGLEKALKEVKANCTEAGLKKEREKKVLDAKHEVSQRQADLDKAMKKGDPEKIDKRKNKLAESRKELQEALDQLDQ